MRNDYGIANNLSTYKNYSSEWKTVCEDCYIESVLGELNFTFYKPPPTKEQNRINPYCKINCFHTPQQCERIRISWNTAFNAFLKKDVIKQDKPIEFYKPGHFKEVIPKYNRWGLIQIPLTVSPDQEAKYFEHWPMILDTDNTYDEHEQLRDSLESAINDVLEGLERAILKKRLYEYEEFERPKRGAPYGTETERKYKTFDEIGNELGKDPKTIRKYRDKADEELKNIADYCETIPGLCDKCFKLAWCIEAIRKSAIDKGIPFPVYGE
jgi:hypothetical protein